MFMRAKFLFSIWYFDNQVAFREKRFFLILAKIQEIKSEETSTERKYANRRLLKTLPRVSASELEQVFFI